MAVFCSIYYLSVLFGWNVNAEEISTINSKEIYCTEKTIENVANKFSSTCANFNFPISIGETTPRRDLSYLFCKKEKYFYCYQLYLCSPYLDNLFCRPPPFFCVKYYC